MTGLKELRDIYKKKGISSIENFLDGDVLITEKLDAHRFSFEVNNDKEIIFFKKNDNRPLTIIDRTISDLYEKAISHIEGLPHLTKYSIPSNIRFGFAYFPSNKPLRIEYKNVHNSKLVLTDITLRSNNGKVKRIYDDINYINRWAKSLNVGKMPVIYSGILDESKKEFIKAAASGENRLCAFFSENISNILGSYSNNNIIEGIVIRSKNGLVQLKDPSFDMFHIAAKPQESRDFYDLVLLQMESFINNDYKMIQAFESNLSDARYLELVSDIYNKYIKHSHIDETLDPSYLQPQIIGNHGQLSRKFIKSPETIENINKGKIYEELYKVFLSSFRKKKKAHGLLTESFTIKFNEIIDDIQNLTNYAPLNEETNNNYINNNNKVADIEDVKEVVDTFKVISSIQKSFDREYNEYNKDDNKKSCVILIGNFIPINNDHINIIKKIAKDSNNKILLCQVESSINKSNTFSISDDLINKILLNLYKNQSEDLFDINSEILYKPIFIKNSTLKEIINHTRNNDLDISMIYTETGEGSNYLLQLHSNQMLCNSFKLNKDLEIKEYKNKGHYDILRCLEDNKFNEIIKYTPKCVAPFLDNINAEYIKYNNIIDSPIIIKK